MLSNCSGQLAKFSREELLEIYAERCTYSFMQQGGGATRRPLSRNRRRRIRMAVEGSYGQFEHGRRPNDEVAPESQISPGMTSLTSPVP